MVPENLNEPQTLRLEGNKTNGFLRDLSFSDLLYRLERSDLLKHLAIKKCEKTFVKKLKNTRRFDVTGCHYQVKRKLHNMNVL